MPSASPPDSSRIFGLDVMRAVAILMVVVSHADDLLAAHIPFEPGMARVDGVDLFFVLSGFLVGGLLLKQMERTEVSWPRRLLDFWQRRWLRTLPNYYLFLLINIALVWTGLATGVLHRNTLAYAVFLQNLIVPLDLFFFESWSLAVEEWFYLLFPVLASLGVLVLGRGSRKGFLLAALVMILVPTVMRLRVPAVGSLNEADLFIRQVVLMRLDSIGCGVLAVWAFHQFPLLWQRFRVPAFVLGMTGIAAVAMVHDAAHLRFVSSWSFTCSAVAMALLLPLLSTWRSAGRPGIPVVFLSRISYALYLVHLPVRHLWLPLVEGRSWPLTLLFYVAYWVLCILLAGLVHRYWELPFMRLRERIGHRITAPVS